MFRAVIVHPATSDVPSIEEFLKDNFTLPTPPCTIPDGRLTNFSFINIVFATSEDYNLFRLAFSDLNIVELKA